MTKNSSPFGSILSMFCVIVPIFLCSAGTAAGEEPDDRSTWRLQWANDVLVGSDNQFTNGFSVQKHSGLYPTLDETEGTLAFGKKLAGLFLPDRQGLSYREGWGVGHNFQTPDDIERESLITDDIPYAGMLAWSNTFIAFDDQNFSGFEILLGWMGPGVPSEEVQSGFHSALGGDDPNGWDNQLDSEPIVNFYFMKKRKLWRKPNFDGAINFDAALGNFFTFGQAGLEIRFGRIPDGFSFVPTPIGRGMDYSATIRPRGQTFTYGTVVFRGTRFLVALPREGNNFTDDNLWTETNTVEMEDSIGQIILGFHVERENWGIHFNIWLSTDTLKRETISGAEDPANEFGAIMVEWRF